jgi:hypothetical protein
MDATLTSAFTSTRSTSPLRRVAPCRRSSASMMWYRSKIRLAFGDVPANQRRVDLSHAHATEVRRQVEREAQLQLLQRCAVVGGVVVDQVVGRVLEREAADRGGDSDALREFALAFGRQRLRVFVVGSLARFVLWAAIEADVLQPPVRRAQRAVGVLQAIDATH